MHFMPYNFLYDPPASFNFDQIYLRIAFRYSFNINIVNMRHTTRFDTHQSLIYHQKPILCILCHITSYTTPQPLSILTKLHLRIAFRYSFNINIVNMRHTTRFDTHQPLIYHLRTALKPIVCFLCHITSYTTPLASFNFDETSSTYCF